jgi:phenylacetate-CoA ligase
MALTISDVIKFDSQTFTRYPHSANEAFKLEWILAIETSPRDFWQAWQLEQLNKLLAFARIRSSFWYPRIQSAQLGKSTSWSKIPILTRAELSDHTSKEGSLFRPFENIANKLHRTSGSTGTPALFFVTDWNAEYNRLRSLATYYIEKRPFNLNRTQLKLETTQKFNFIRTETYPSWSPFEQTGLSKIIEYRPISSQSDDRTLKKLRKELEQDATGYLIANPWVVERLLNAFGIEFFKDIGTYVWIPNVWTPDSSIYEQFANSGMPIRAIYSSEEVGVIGTECPKIKGNYHISVSNVIVEVDVSEPVLINGKILGKVLITHLHSYASPIIRYDIGDIAHLEGACQCGHDGPTLSMVFGRKKHILKLPDGGSRIFTVFLMDCEWLTKYKEFRFRQTKHDTIVFEVAHEGRFSDEKNLKELISNIAGQDMKVEIVCLRRIDWGGDRKRNIFISSVA